MKELEIIKEKLRGVVKRSRQLFYHGNSKIFQKNTDPVTKHILGAPELEKHPSLKSRTAHIVAKAEMTLT